MDARILLIEDEAEVAAAARQWLSAAGYEVHSYSDGASALKQAEALVRMDSAVLCIALIDLHLPGSEGERICRQLRAMCDWPVILVAAQQDRLDERIARRMGADDWLSKPYKPLALLGRVREQLALYLRRAGLPALPEPAELSVRGLRLARAERQCSVDGRAVTLTHTEFALLWEMCLTPGKPISAPELYRRVWRDEYLEPAANTIMVHIRHLRVKLGDGANPEPYIRTVWREGYKVEP